MLAADVDAPQTLLDGLHRHKSEMQRGHALARHPRERMASLHLALVTMEAVQQCLGSVDVGGKHPGPSCFMTEGHDVDNADSKWLCPECHTDDEAAAQASSTV